MTRISVRLPSLNIDTSPATWQRRTLRYLAIYLLLAMTLVATRYMTQHIRPNLRDAQARESQLLTERDDLEIRVQVAQTPQKVQDWAVAHGMQRFAESPKTTADLGNLPVPPPKPPANTLEMSTQWRPASPDAAPAPSPSATPQPAPEGSSSHGH